MFRSFRKIKIEKDWIYRLNIYSRKSNELDRFCDEDPDGVVVGIVGNFSSGHSIQFRISFWHESAK